MGSRVVVPVGSFPRGFYFLGFGGWAAALPFCPFWSFLGTAAPLPSSSPNTFNRSPSGPILSFIS